MWGVDVAVHGRGHILLLIALAGAGIATVHMDVRSGERNKGREKRERDENQGSHRGSASCRQVRASGCALGCNHLRTYGRGLRAASLGSIRTKLRFSVLFAWGTLGANVTLVDSP